MTVQTTYSQARTNLSALLDQITQDRQVVIIRRRGKADVALISADELSGLIETVHLLRSPRNAERLLAALDRALEQEGQHHSIDDLRQALGLEPETE